MHTKTTTTKSYSQLCATTLLASRNSMGSRSERWHSFAAFFYCTKLRPATRRKWHASMPNVTTKPRSSQSTMVSPMPSHTFIDLWPLCEIAPALLLNYTLYECVYTGESLSKPCPFLDMFREPSINARVSMGRLAYTLALYIICRRNITELSTITPEPDGPTHRLRLRQTLKPCVQFELCHTFSANRARAHCYMSHVRRSLGQTWAADAHHEITERLREEIPECAPYHFDGCSMNFDYETLVPAGLRLPLNTQRSKVMSLPHHLNRYNEPKRPSATGLNVHPIILKPMQGTFLIRRGASGEKSWIKMRASQQAYNQAGKLAEALGEQPFYETPSLFLRMARKTVVKIAEAASDVTAAGDSMSQIVWQLAPLV
jgi:hypothetical protein